MHKMICVGIDPRHLWAVSDKPPKYTADMIWTMAHTHTHTHLTNASTGTSLPGICVSAKCVSVLKGPPLCPDGDINSRQFRLSTHWHQRVEEEQQVE